MSKILVLRIVLDVEDDVIRDIAIRPENSLFDLHNFILGIFELSEGEMSSFFIADPEWNQGEEISLMDYDSGSGENAQEARKVGEMFEEIGDRMLFVYDYLNLWTFYLEFIKEREHQEDRPYPHLLASLGDRPEEAPEKSMQAEGEDDFGPEHDDEGDDPYDMEEDWF